MIVDKWIHPTGRTPEHVIMLLLGESKRQYADALSKAHHRIFTPDTEIWTCNAGFRIWRHDLLFVMDDLEGESHKWPDYGRDLEVHNRPMITSTAYARWPQARGYPLKMICDELQLTGLDRYFYNTVPYMLAYALFIGVKAITIFGADYYHPAVPMARESDLANAEWWLGFLRARHVQITLASDTTMMHARNSGQPLYGYRHDPRISMDRPKALNATPIEDPAPRELSPEAAAFVADAEHKTPPPIQVAAEPMAERIPPETTWSHARHQPDD